VIARTAHRADAKPLGRDGVDLAVGMTRDQDLERKSSAQERQHEMLTMPHRQNERLLVLMEPMRIRRLHREAAGHPHKTQIFGRCDADCLLDPAFLRQPSRKLHGQAFLVGIMVALRAGQIIDSRQGTLIGKGSYNR
jgi:hypothetical protein